VIVWAIPALVILFLGGIAWVGSHDLDPPRALQSNTEPLEVQVVSLDWQWLFIYPDQHIASLNHLVPYLWREWITSVDHKRIGVMYMLLALVMLLRGFSDAIMMRSAAGAGAGGTRGLPAARALRPDLLRARHHHDLLRGDAVRDRADELRRAAAARRARRRVSGAQLGQLLADRVRRAAGQHVAGGRRVRAHRLARLSAAVASCLLAGRRRRLLPVVAADLRRRHAADPASTSSPPS
jgi:hypothetical protein